MTPEEIISMIKQRQRNLLLTMKEKQFGTEGALYLLRQNARYDELRGLLEAIKCSEDGKV